MRNCSSNIYTTKEKNKTNVFVCIRAAKVVPVKTPIAGVAMGLIMENSNKYAIFSLHKTFPFKVLPIKKIVLCILFLINEGRIS